MLASCACTQEQLQSPRFQQWLIPLKQPTGWMHRKMWEWAYIAQALHERGMLQPGRRGLGFAVGREPLAALFAGCGCDIVATDLDEAQAVKDGWVQTNQHAASLEALNENGVCPPELFHQRVQFRSADMNRLPADLDGFDFVWSSCSIEHLGSIQAGQQFMLNMMRCLKPGGIAVHTTEYNVSSNIRTIRRGGSVLFRRRDLCRMVNLLSARGHRVAPLDFRTGQQPADLHVDLPPYPQKQHLKLRIGRYDSTSFGIIVQAGAPSAGRKGNRFGRWLRSWFARRAVQTPGM
jgi:SAM-dependent methyltransferase